MNDREKASEFLTASFETGGSATTSHVPGLLLNVLLYLQKEGGSSRPPTRLKVFENDGR